MSFFYTFVAYLKLVIKGGAGAREGGAIVPTMTTIAIGNRRSQIIPKTSSYGPAPTKPEIEKVMLDFKRTMNAGYGSPASISITNTRESIVHESHSVDTSTIIMKPLLSPAEKKLLDAFHLMESDASIRKVVMSISTDHHVWESFVRNKAVQEFHSSKPCAANEEAAMSYTQDGVESASQIIKWLFSFMTSGVTEFIKKVQDYVLGALQCLSRSNNTMLPLDGVLEERVRSPILLSIVLLMVYFVTKSMDMENS